MNSARQQCVKETKEKAKKNNNNAIIISDESGGGGGGGPIPPTSPYVSTHPEVDGCLTATAHLSAFI